MARVKRGVIAKARHRKVLDKAKGYYGARSRVYRVAKSSAPARTRGIIRSSSVISSDS